MDDVAESMRAFLSGAQEYATEPPADYDVGEPVAYASRFSQPMNPRGFRKPVYGSAPFGTPGDWGYFLTPMGRPGNALWGMAEGQPHHLPDYAARNRWFRAEDPGYGALSWQPWEDEMRRAIMRPLSDPEQEEWARWADPEYANWFETLRADPDDWVSRLTFADWLADRGIDDRAKQFRTAAETIRNYPHLRHATELAMGPPKPPPADEIDHNAPFRREDYARTDYATPLTPADVHPRLRFTRLGAWLLRHANSADDQVAQLAREILTHPQTDPQVENAAVAALQDMLQENPDHALAKQFRNGGATIHPSFALDQSVHGHLRDTFAAPAEPVTWGNVNDLWRGFTNPQALRTMPAPQATAVDLALASIFGDNAGVDPAHLRLSIQRLMDQTTHEENDRGFQVQEWLYPEFTDTTVQSRAEWNRDMHEQLATDAAELHPEDGPDLYAAGPTHYSPESFLQSIAQDPEEQTHRAVFADWLQENTGHLPPYLLNFLRTHRGPAWAGWSPRGVHLNPDGTPRLVTGPRLSWEDLARLNANPHTDGPYSWVANPSTGRGGEHFGFFPAFTDLGGADTPEFHAHGTPHSGPGGYFFTTRTDVNDDFELNPEWLGDRAHVWRFNPGSGGVSIHSNTYPGMHGPNYVQWADDWAAQLASGETQPFDERDLPDVHAEEKYPWFREPTQSAAPGAPTAYAPAFVPRPALALPRPRRHVFSLLPPLDPRMVPLDPAIYEEGPESFDADAFTSLNGPDRDYWRRRTPYTSDDWDEADNMPWDPVVPQQAPAQTPPPQYNPPPPAGSTAHLWGRDDDEPDESPDPGVPQVTPADIPDNERALLRHSHMSNGNLTRWRDENGDLVYVGLRQSSFSWYGTPVSIFRWESEAGTGPWQFDPAEARAGATAHAQEQAAGVQARGPIREAVGGVVSASFPGTARQTPTGEWFADVGGDRLVVVETRPEQNAMLVNFFNEGTPGLGSTQSGPAVRAGSMDLVHAMQALAANALEAGLDFGYGKPSDNRRARIYAKTLWDMGYVPTTPIGHSIVWTPAANVDPAEAQQRYAYLMDKIKKTPDERRYAADGDPTYYGPHDDLGLWLPRFRGLHPAAWRAHPDEDAAVDLTPRFMLADMLGEAGRDREAEILQDKSRHAYLDFGGGVYDAGDVLRQMHTMGGPGPWATDNFTRRYIDEMLEHAYQHGIPSPVRPGMENIDWRSLAAMIADAHHFRAAHEDVPGFSHTSAGDLLYDTRSGRFEFDPVRSWNIIAGRQRGPEIRSFISEMGPYLLHPNGEDIHDLRGPYSVPNPPEPSPPDDVDHNATRLSRYATNYAPETPEEWQAAIDENPFESTAHAAFADWLGDRGAAEEAAFRRAVADWYQQLHAGGLAARVHLPDHPIPWGWPAHLRPEWAYLPDHREVSEALPAGGYDQAYLEHPEYRADPADPRAGYLASQWGTPWQGGQHRRWATRADMEGFLRELWAASRRRLAAPVEDVHEYAAPAAPTMYADATTIRALLKRLRSDPYDDSAHAVLADALEDVYPGHPVAAALRRQLGLGEHAGADPRENQWNDFVSNAWDGTFPHTFPIGNAGPFRFYLGGEGRPDQNPTWHVHAVGDLPGVRDTGYTFEFPAEAAHELPALFPKARAWVQPGADVPPDERVRELFDFYDQMRALRDVSEEEEARVKSPTFQGYARTDYADVRASMEDFLRGGTQYASPWDVHKLAERSLHDDVPDYAFEDAVLDVGHPLADQTVARARGLREAGLAHPAMRDVALGHLQNPGFTNALLGLGPTFGLSGRNRFHGLGRLRPGGLRIGRGAVDAFHDRITLPSGRVVTGVDGRVHDAEIQVPHPNPGDAGSGGVHGIYPHVYHPLSHMLVEQEAFSPFFPTYRNDAHSGIGSLSASVHPNELSQLTPFLPNELQEAIAQWAEGDVFNRPRGYGTDGGPTAYGPEEDEAGFRAAWNAEPLEGTHHAAFADWLDEAGRPDEAAFHRSVGDWLRTRAPTFRKGHERPWKIPGPIGVSHSQYPEGIRGPQRFMLHGVVTDRFGWPIHDALTNDPAVGVWEAEDENAPENGWGTSWRSYDDMLAALRESFLDGLARRRQEEAAQVPPTNAARYA